MQMRLTYKEGFPEMVEVGRTYRFVRDAPRRYMPGRTCYLHNGNDYHPLAEIKITETETDGIKTRGFFVVVKKLNRRE